MLLLLFLGRQESGLFTWAEQPCSTPGSDAGWGCSAALTFPFQLCPIPGLCCGAASVCTPPCLPHGGCRAGQGFGVCGALGSDQGHLPQPYIFSCLIARAKCTRLCCRMLPLGSWQRLILKCQLLSRGTGSNELPQFALVPGTGAPSPTLPRQQGNDTTRKGISFPSPKMKVKNFRGVCAST